MGKPGNFAMKVIDGVVGGWTLAGNFSYRSGNPITLTGSSASNVNNGVIKVNQTWGSYASSDHNLISPSFQNFNQVLTGALQSYDTPHVWQLRQHQHNAPLSQPL